MASDVPVDKVKALREQGMDNNQIIQTLQGDGYTSSQIFDALSQSEIKGPHNDSGGPQNPAPQFQPPQQSFPDMSSGDDSVSTEELIEAIIDEKWGELVKDINKVVDWKNKMDSRISSIEQEIKDVKEQFDRLHKAVVGKVGEYDKNILEVGSEVRAMEKVFSKALPQFSESVSELSKIVSQLKKK